MVDSQQHSVLVIDDDDVIRIAFIDYLEDMGYQVLGAENGRVGVNLFDTQQIDLVMVDLRMPEMDGLEVLEYITRKAPDIPLIVISGTGIISDAIEALHKGAWDYILKPIEDYSILDHAIEGALEKKRLRQENRRYQQHLEQIVDERTEALTRANAQLHASEKQFRLILDHIRIGIVIVEEDSRHVLYVNPTAAQMVKCSADEIIGSRCHDVLCPTKPDGCPVLNSGSEIESAEKFLKTIDGERIPVLKSVSRTIFDGKACLLESFVDLTAQKKTEAEKKVLENQLLLAQKMEALGTLAGGIAHDFNNILGVIIGCTELAIMTLPDQSPESKHMHQVLDASQRASELVQQILTFSRQKELEKQPLRVSIVMKEVIKMLRATLPSTIEIRQEINPDSGLTMADPAQIHQILMNLGTNAAHAMPGKGVLQMTLGNFDFSEGRDDVPEGLNPGAYLKMTVSDTGQGMDRTTLDRIFDPYFTTKQPGEGTGLGLAVVMGIVKNYGGSIFARSEPGQGTCFDVYLKRIDVAAGTDQSETPERALPAGTERVLLVDDENQLATVAGNVLRNLGYLVQVESDSQRALDEFKKNPMQFDLVLSDVTMPHLPGDELARELLRIRPDVPIILCTGFSNRLTPAQAKSIGVRDLIFKPLQMETLAVCVRQALDG
jgi:PAS domain S-box-containing protein